TYNWSPLIGSIDSTIPSGSLTISRHTVPGPFHLDSAGNFEQAGNRFTVGGIARVKGRGLVLRKKVGEQEADLSIAQTTAVRLAG
ncbi:MAG: hypothetical protein GWO24_33820, partial [Akkermansiaceae bacterium]|nr:hypothetical protein [Akkermansiaceae bacterium]